MWDARRMKAQLIFDNLPNKLTSDIRNDSNAMMEEEGTKEFDASLQKASLVFELRARFFQAGSPTEKLTVRLELHVRLSNATRSPPTSRGSAENAHRRTSHHRIIAAISTFAQ